MSKYYAVADPRVFSLLPVMTTCSLVSRTNGRVRFSSAMFAGNTLPKFTHDFFACGVESKVGHPMCIGFSLVDF